MTSDTARGLLCIWTDIDPVHGADFNDWYNTEHMQERVAIPGFRNARRFIASKPCPLPYLALYYTDALAVFRSEPYVRAFANQTPWSLENFKRMRGTQRRVGRLSVETGAGEGGAMGLFVVPAAPLAQAGAVERIAGLLKTVVSQNGVISAALLQTDAALSTPISTAAVPVPADGLIMVEATHKDAALVHAAALSTSLGLSEDAVYSFQTLFRLASTDLFRKEH